MPRNRPRVQTRVWASFRPLGAITVALLLSSGCGGGAQQQPQHTVADLQQPDTAYSQRFSDEARQWLLSLEEGDDPIVRAMFRTNAAMTPTIRSRIKAVGIQVESAVGDVLVTTTRARRLLDLAALDFVTRIEIEPPQR